MINELSASVILVKSFSKNLSSESKNYPVKSGYSKNNFCWSYQKNFLQIINLENSDEPKPLSKFNFVHLLEDKSVFITCVTEFKNYNLTSKNQNEFNYKLLVSLDRETSGSLFLIIDVKNHKILKCIEFPFKITCIEPIVTNCDNDKNILPFCPELQKMCGIVALGTQSGLIMLLDLCLDRINYESEYFSSSTVTFIIKNNQDLESKRKSSFVHNQHMCIVLNDECQYKGDFVYKENNGIYKTFSPDEILITSLKYFYQTNSLYIGYNFGGFQSYNLKNLNMYLACALEDYLLPVIGFSLHEPENDPRFYCYLWVIRGIANDESERYNSADICSFATLFVLEYESRKWIENYGNLYSQLLSEEIKFEYYMTTSPYLVDIDEGVNSCLINYGIINQGSVSMYKSKNEVNDYLDLSLFYIVWKAFDNINKSPVFYCAIFDLNQWYQAQMPNFIQTINQNIQLCSFISIYKLNDIENLINPENILDIKFDENSFIRFKSINYENEIFYYPSSLSFKLKILSESKSLEATYFGLQKRLIDLFDKDSKEILLDPDEFIDQCYLVGILNIENNKLKTLKDKQETILTLALDNKKFSFLSQVITDWSTGEYNQFGCNCKSFLDWLWNEVTNIKNSTDLIVVPLFDFSGDQFEEKKIDELNLNEVKLKFLQILLKKLTTNGAPITNDGEKNLILRYELMQLIIDYIDIIIWCCINKLLPEFEEGSENGEILELGYCYPRKQLEVDYLEKKKNLIALNPSVIKLNDILTIDGLILHTKPVYDLWISHDSNGMYPPPSLYSLLSIYLLDSVSIDVKHQIMLYALCDIFYYKSNYKNDLNEKLKNFSFYFNIKSELTQLVEGMWALDHKSFDFALTQFCDASIRLVFPNEFNNYKELDNDLQKRILMSFLYQDKITHALQFVKMSYFLTYDTLDKQKLYISVMLRNKLVMEAFNFQKECRNKENVEELLFHFYLGCETMKLMDIVFRFTLDELEKEALICYLLEVSKSVNSGNLLIIYFLLNKKIIDAYKFIEIIEEKMRKYADNDHFNKFLNIKAIVHSYINVLPASVVNLNLEIKSIAENLKKSTTVINNVNPKKVFVGRHLTTNECSKAVNDLLKKVDSILSNENIDNKIDTPFRKRIEKHGLLIGDNLPFVRQSLSKSLPELKNDIVSNLSFNQIENLESTRNNFNMEIIKNSDLNQSTENNFNLLSIINKPKIQKFKTNNYNSYITIPSSILKVEELINSNNRNNHSKRHIQTKLSFLDSTNDNFNNISAIESENKIDNINLTDMSVDSEIFINTDKKNEFATPNKPMNPSFVFSPPLTRSRKKKGTRDEEDEGLSVNDTFELDKKIEEKKSSKKTMKKTYKTIKNETPKHSMSLRNTKTCKK